MILEVIAMTVDDAVNAQRAGADRIELVQAIELGGLTPTPAMVAAVKGACGLPILAMVRPRPGGFYYSAAEFEVLLGEAQALMDAGADGLVFGCLEPDGALDWRRMERLTEIAGGKTTVCHRSFDATPDPRRALQRLAELGITRVMTSGQSGTAESGIPHLRAWREEFAGHIEILPGGGIRDHNAPMILKQTGCDQVHCGLFRDATDATSALPGKQSYGSHKVTDAEAVQAVRSAIDQA